MSVAPEVWEVFNSYPWPGNVRELKNVIERALILEREALIQPGSLILRPAGESQVRTPATPEAAAAATGAVSASASPTGIRPLEEMERELVTKAMRATGDNQTRAAELLGVTRDQLRYRLKKFNLGG